MRRKVKNRNIVKPDIKFNSEKVEKFINRVMVCGKKQTAREIVYGAFEVVKEKAKNYMEKIKETNPEKLKEWRHNAYLNCKANQDLSLIHI